MQKEQVTEISRRVLAGFCLGLDGTPSLVVDTWTIPYVKGGKKLNAFVADESLTFQNALRTFLHSVDDVYNDEELLGSVDILVHQTDQLLNKLGVTVTVPQPSYGSVRYRKVVYAHDRLTDADVQLSGNRVKWESTSVDGRNGCEIVHRLKPIKELLQKMGEGAPQPVP
jgi:hypothetical protein